SSRRRHTRWPRDWSSDVCSSDLGEGTNQRTPQNSYRAALTFLEEFCGVRWLVPSPLGEVIPQRKDVFVPDDLDRTVVPAFAYTEIGRASCRERVLIWVGGVSCKE